MRFFPLTVALVTGCLAVAELANPAPLLIWNLTESVPPGLYINTGNVAQKGTIVAINPPLATRIFLSKRGYLPENVPLLKQVAAIPEDEICHTSDLVLINKEPAARIKISDSLGRQLPQRAGCFVLQDDEFFLLGSHKNSLDGRYFGATKSENIIGTYRLIWRPAQTRERQN